MTVEVIIPWRDRGRDPLRAANLKRVLEHWEAFRATVTLTDDGLSGDQQFNRSESYNRAIRASDADLLILTESDMLIDFTQIEQALVWAEESLGLVVPFSERHEHSPTDSDRIRRYEVDPTECQARVIKPKPRRTGAINVISRGTYNAVGQYDSAFCGSWFDDRSMHIAFDVCAGPTRWVDGPSHHLYHLPGYEGQHLTAADIAATQANRRRFGMYQRARTPQQIHQLTIGTTCSNDHTHYH